MRTIERDAAPMGGRGKVAWGVYGMPVPGGAKKMLQTLRERRPRNLMQIVAINLEAELGSMNLAQSLGLQRFSP